MSFWSRKSCLSYLFHCIYSLTVKPLGCSLVTSDLYTIRLSNIFLIPWLFGIWVHPLTSYFDVLANPNTFCFSFPALSVLWAYQSASP